MDVAFAAGAAEASEAQPPHAPARDGDCGCRGRAVEAGDGRDTRPPATVGLASPAAEADDLIGPRTAVDACEHAVRTDGGGHQRAPQTLRRRMRRPASREFAGLWVELADSDAVERPAEEAVDQDSSAVARQHVDAVPG